MVLPAFDHRTGHFEDVLIHYNSVWLTLKEPLIAVSHRRVPRRMRRPTDFQQLQYLKMFGAYRNLFACVWFDARRLCRVETTKREQRWQIYHRSYCQCHL